MCLAVLAFSTSVCFGTMVSKPMISPDTIYLKNNLFFFSQLKCPLDFKEWLTCPKYKDKANVKISNTFIDHELNAIKVSCDIDVFEDFGHNEISVS